MMINEFLDDGEQLEFDFFENGPEAKSTKKQEKINTRDVHFLMEKYKEEMDNVRPSLAQLIDHLDHIAKLIGVDHIGIGSDFDGINSAPRELNDVTNMPLITEELLKRGYSKKDIAKILGGNFIRVLKANQVDQ